MNSPLGNPPKTKPHFERLHGLFQARFSWILKIIDNLLACLQRLELKLSVGAFILAVGLLYSLFIIVNTLLNGVATPGYVTLLTAVVAFGGIQLIGIGVLGEYVGRIYLEVKGRPPYLVDTVEGEKNSREKM